VSCRVNVEAVDMCNFYGIQLIFILTELAVRAGICLVGIMVNFV